MIDPAHGLFESFDSWAAIVRLVDNGESEGPYLECKTATGIHLQPGHRTHLAQALSGFSNTGGGVVIWGISTTPQAHTGLDILTQIEPIGNCSSFRQQIDVAMPTLAYPAVEGCVTKTLHPSTGTTKGVVLAYIPKTPGDPVQALGEKKFYLRSGADFVEMPYETLKRMFAGTSGPDLAPVFDGRVVRNEGAGVWRVPIILTNRSSAAAEQTQVNVTFLNPSACELVTPEGGFYEMSSVNPGKTMFGVKAEGPIFRELNQIVGTLVVKMKRGKRPRRILKLRISVFSSRMRARQWDMTVQLASKGLSVKKTQEKFLY